MVSRAWGRAGRRLAAGLVVWLTAALALTGVSGCSAVGYYAQSLQGHVALMRQAKPVADWLADPATPPELRERLQLAQRLRAFAVSDLGLPDNPSYHRYADLGRSAVVWNVVATPELSLTLKTWCYPVMGCVGYRGYFNRAEADAEAAALQAQGLEVLVYGVPAYSTLGWTNWLGGDPLLNTFIRGSEAELARLVFHELTHQVVYAADDTMFNESYATAVERLGWARWQAASGNPPEDPQWLRRRSEFRAITHATRQALDTLYKSGAPEAELRAGKARLLQSMREQYVALKAGPWAGFNGYDGWMARANNAALALQNAYDGLVPAFERIHQQQGGDFARLHAEAKRLANLPKAVRRATLDALMARPPAAPGPVPAASSAQR